MHEWFFDFSDIASMALRLMFLLWLYTIIKKHRQKGQTEGQSEQPPEKQSRRKRRRKRTPKTKQPPNVPPAQPDADDAKLASKGTQYGKGMYHDGDKPVHKDNETLQHDKGRTYHDGEKPVHTDAKQPGRDEGRRYRDGDKPVHTDNEKLQYDKGRVFKDRAKAQPQLIAEPREADSLSAQEELQGDLAKGKLKLTRKKLVRPALAQQFVMSQIFPKPKGLE